MQAELESQPEIWRRVLTEPPSRLDLLPLPGADVVVTGCGASLHVGAAYARRREAVGGGRTRAVAASELDRLYEGEEIVVVSRAGAEPEVIEMTARLGQQAVITAVLGGLASPLATRCDRIVVLPYADEVSPVPTRFPTAALTLLRSSLGEDLSSLPDAAQAALEVPPELGDEDHFVFLGAGEGTGLAACAALACLVAAGVAAEAYPAAEYLNGPIAAAGPGSLVWSLSPVPARVQEALARSGARLVAARFTAQVELVRCQRLALALARLRGRDPDAGGPAG